MIEDPKLRELFKVESAEHLQHLDDELLRLEKAPGDKPLLEEAFREAHSLKGAARMLGLGGVQALAHRLEEGLNLARGGAQVLEAQAIARMSGELAELRRLVSEALAPAAAAQAPAKREAPAEAPAPAPAASAPYRIESVRVDTSRLDTLMTHAGELAVTKTRVARRLADIDALIESCEEWSRKAAPERLGEVVQRLGEFRAGQAEDSARLDYVSGELECGIRFIRLLPLSTVFALFPRFVHDLAHEQGKEVELAIEGGDTSADKRILEEVKDPVMHLLRNAVHHGIETPQKRAAAGKPRAGAVRIKASQLANSVLIEVSDDGRGLDEAAIKRAAAKRGLESEEALAAMSAAQIHALIFASGLSTVSFVTDVSGRGVGLDVVRTNVERLKGTIEVRSTPERGTSIAMRLPTTLATVRVLVAEVNGHCYGLPAEAVEEARSVTPADIFPLEGRDAVLHRGRPVSVARLAELLELPNPAVKARIARASSPCVFLAAGERTIGVFVDALLDEQEVVLKAQSGLLKRVRNVSGATILDSGEICVVLDAAGLIASIRRRVAPGASLEAGATPRKKGILLAEDSITTRTQEARILENAGYEVVTAVDGLEAWNKLAARAFDAVVTDVVMPNLDGLSLTERIRRERKYADLPVILVTSLATDADRKRGLEAGANAYIAKPAFDQQVLLDCLARLV